MKKMILVSAICLFSAQFASAQSCPSHTAIVTAKIANLQKTAKGCTTYLQAEKVELFTPAYSCALDFGDVSGYPIELGLDNSGNCRFDINDEMSGILHKLPNGTIVLQ